MDEVEFLFQCVRDGKLSKEQADTILNKKSLPSASLQKAATFSPGFSQHQSRAGAGMHIPHTEAYSINAENNQ